MATHPSETEIERLAFGRLATAESLSLQRRPFNCGACLMRLIEFDYLLTLEPTNVVVSAQQQWVGDRNNWEHPCSYHT